MEREYFRGGQGKTVEEIEKARWLFVKPSFETTYSLNARDAIPNAVVAAVILAENAHDWPERRWSAALEHNLGLLKYREGVFTGSNGRLRGTEARTQRTHVASVPCQKPANWRRASLAVL
jgi:hypothetical protein